MIERKIVDYKLIAEDTEGSLVYDIKLSIKHGWQPFGGISFLATDQADNAQYTQAMVKYEDELNNESKNKASPIKNFLNLDVSSLKLSNRTKNSLLSENIRKISDFTKLSPELRIRNIGQTSRMEIIIEIIRLMVKYEE